MLIISLSALCLNNMHQNQINDVDGGKFVRNYKPTDIFHLANPSSNDSPADGSSNSASLRGTRRVKPDPMASNIFFGGDTTGESRFEIPNFESSCRREDNESDLNDSDVLRSDPNALGEVQRMRDNNPIDWTSIDGGQEYVRGSRRHYQARNQSSDIFFQQQELEKATCLNHKTQSWMNSESKSPSFSNVFGDVTQEDSLTKSSVSDIPFKASGQTSSNLNRNPKGRGRRSGYPSTASQIWF